MRRLFLLVTAAGALAQQPPVRRSPPRDYRPPYVFVNGVVKDADTNEPIAGARVRLRAARPNTRVLEQNIVTKLGGGFGAMLADDDRLLIQVEADGYTESIADRERGPLIIVRNPASTRESVEVRLHRSGEIEGQLFDRALETPVPGITVRAHWSVFDRGRRVLKPVGVAVSSDAEGRFLLAGLPPAGYFLEIVQKEQERIEERAVAARKPSEGYAREYWPGGGMLEAALPLPSRPVHDSPWAPSSFGSHPCSASTERSFPPTAAKPYAIECSFGNTAKGA